MSDPDASQTSATVRNVGRCVLAEGKASLRAFWRAFSRVTAVATGLFCLFYFTLHPNDLRGPPMEVVFGVAIVLGYSAFYGLWIGLAAGTFVTAWRWWGVWIMVPMVGAVSGAAAAVSLALVLLSRMDSRGAGLHGGGDVAALLALGLLAVCALIGAVG
ncbi:MAG: hypothetical protein K6T86_11230, partial [Pirellulales bacterium]|nr:hypothetical protein [Pirellulales bacterium]